MTNAEIDQVVTVIQDLVKVASIAYPPLAVAAPLISAFIKFEAIKLKTGLADGTLVPDGHGGVVPASNSRFDPKTGEFI